MCAVYLRVAMDGARSQAIAMCGDGPLRFDYASVRVSVQASHRAKAEYAPLADLQGSRSIQTGS